MKKRVLSVVLSLLMALSLLPGRALAADTSGKCGDNLTWTLDGAGTFTIKGSGPMYDYRGGGQPWAASRSSVKKIVVEKGATKIGTYAFADCRNMTSAELPAGIIAIGTGAFKYCFELASVEIPSSVTEIGGEAFNGCFMLPKITIPSSVKSIGDQAFSGCSGATSLTIPSSVTGIGSWAFSGCRSLTTVTVPSSVEYIGRNVFMDCGGLTSVKLLCQLSISPWMFSGCGRLTSITVPSGAYEIGYRAFEGCAEVTKVYIPSRVATINPGAFAGMNKLSDVYYGGTKAQWEKIAIENIDNDPLFNATIHFNSDPIEDDPAAKTYTVTFNPNGGTVAMASRKYSENSVYGDLPIPTRSGYDFKGWYTAKSGGTKVSETQKVTANRTLYARWSETTAKVTITLNANGGTVSPKSISVNKNAAYYSQLPTPTRSGYKFDGWYTAKSGGTKITASAKASVSRTVYAHWTKTAATTKIKITLNANGGKVSPASISVDKNTAYFTQLPTPTRTGYEFDGWFTAKSGGTKITSAAKATANRTIYAHWTEGVEEKDINLQVTFNPNGGTVIQKRKTVLQGTRYRDLPTPTRSGYQFQGWYTAKTGGTKVTEKTKAVKSANHTLYARWSKSALTVRTAESGHWTVYVPPYCRLALFSSQTGLSQSASNAPKTGEYAVKCTKTVTLSNGTQRYYGSFNGKNYWFQFSCEMDMD